MMFPLVRDLAADPIRKIPVAVTCRNVLNRRRPWQTREQLRVAIVVWIETTYHRRRRQDTLGRLTPIEYETLHQTAHAA